MNMCNASNHNGCPTGCKCIESGEAYSTANTTTTTIIIITTTTITHNNIPINTAQVGLLSACIIDPPKCRPALALHRLSLQLVSQPHEWQSREGDGRGLEALTKEPSETKLLCAESHETTPLMVDRVQRVPRGAHCIRVRHDLVALSIGTRSLGCHMQSHPMASWDIVKDLSCGGIVYPRPDTLMPSVYPGSIRTAAGTPHAQRCGRRPSATGDLPVVAPQPCEPEQRPRPSERRCFRGARATGVGYRRPWDARCLQNTRFHSSLRGLSCPGGDEAISPPLLGQFWGGRGRVAPRQSAYPTEHASICHCGTVVFLKVYLTKAQQLPSGTCGIPEGEGREGGGKVEPPRLGTVYLKDNKCARRDC